ncbi:conserved fungal protein [Gigaspora margarita]|uniref:Conserved fungal protein n=1 Tax=Gigaspora margarita TaxID=4874 RepID=A0A8H4B4T1_GIGMA|nr:conserved fungal protein [Gigaspora margarita]
MFKLSTIGKITIISIILQAIINTILECFVIYLHVSLVSQYELDSNSTGQLLQGISEADLIYHAIFIISLFFQILLVVDALWRRNSVQIVALVIFNLLSLAYAGIQLNQHQILEEQGTNKASYNPKDPMFQKGDAYRNTPKDYFEPRMRPIEHTIIGLISVFSIYLAFMSYLLTKEFGWENYRTYSADVRVRDAFWNLTILQTLIKMDVFFIGSYALQLIPSNQIGYYSKVPEIALVFFFGTLILLISWVSVMYEMKYLLLSAINLYGISVIYWAYRLISICIPSSSETDPYEFTRRFLIFFLAVILILVLITVLYSIICFRNMMRGLYVLTVFGRPENEPEGRSPYVGTNNNYLGPNNNYLGTDDNLESPSSKRMSNRESAIRQQQLFTQQQHGKPILD